jgi:DNA replication protein DnaC
MVERRIRTQPSVRRLRKLACLHFLAVKSFDTFDFVAIPSINKPLVLELACYEYLVARENIIALGNSGTGKSHACLALGLAACQRGFSVAFFTAASLVPQLMEARDERRLLKLQDQLAAVKLFFIDELGYVSLSQTGTELLFEIFSQRLTGALLDRLTHHVHILELNGESYRLKQSKARRRRDPRPSDEAAAAAADPETDEIIPAS